MGRARRHRRTMEMTHATCNTFTFTFDGSETLKRCPCTLLASGHCPALGWPTLEVLTRAALLGWLSLAGGGTLRPVMAATRMVMDRWWGDNGIRDGRLPSLSSSLY